MNINININMNVNINININKADITDMIDTNEDMNINIQKKLQSRFNIGGDCAPTTSHSGDLFGRVLTIQFRIFHPFALHKECLLQNSSNSYSTNSK